MLLIWEETNAGDKSTHSLPPCRQPETVNPKLMASGPHRDIPLCPSSCALPHWPVCQLQNRCLMVAILKVELVLPPSFTFQPQQPPCSPSSLRVQLYPTLDSLSRLSKELKRKPKASTQIGWWLSSKSPKEGSYKGTAQGQLYPWDLHLSWLVQSKSFSPQYSRKTNVTSLQHNKRPAIPTLTQSVKMCLVPFEGQYKGGEEKV